MAAKSKAPGTSGLRMGVATAVGLVVAALLVVLSAPRYAPAVGWDAAALIYLTWTWLAVWPMDADETRTHAVREDPSRSFREGVLLVAAVASLAAVGFFLIQASSAQGATQDLLAGTGVLTVALSWLLVHTVYTVRYAFLYYGGDSIGGIDFNQKEPPRYSDFAYLSLTLGMTFQVSDTDIETTTIRGTALGQALLSYLFGAVILATTINLIASMAS